jgi:nucleotidyltransferase AbiEii toxin of type IV toxin-antitoxin system
VTAADRYATPNAFRRALTDRLKSLTGTSRWTVPQLQRHVAYDRLLERLYLFDPDWVVKGATALMARELGTRGTLDIDLYREISLAAAEADLRHAAAADIGDWFRFDVGAATPVGSVGVRLPVTSVIGTTTWAGFHVDLIGSGLRMTGQPEHVPPLAANAIPEAVQHGYQAYPLVDHVADKIAATYVQYGTAGMPSTRYRDLVDLVSIVTGACVPAADQISALVSEFDRRQLNLPASFDVPDRRLWEPGYAAEARRSLLPEGRTLDEALSIVKPFTDPLLNQTAAGRWDPGSRQWLRA